MSLTPTPALPPRNQLPYIPVHRLGPAATVAGPLTCITPISQLCHFIGNRTLPCVSENCPGCTANRRQIRECYVSMINKADRRHIITVLTPTAELQLSDCAPDKTNLQGLNVRISREGKRPNGRIRLTTENELTPSSHLPKPPDLLRHLYVIWGLTPELLSTEHPLFECRAQFDFQEHTQNGNGQRTAEQSLPGT